MADADTTAAGRVTVPSLAPAAWRAATQVEAPADMLAERVDIAAVGLAAQSVAADTMAAVVVDSTAAVVVTAVAAVTGNPAVRAT
jgi:hypothetical protein